jgi:hypothetical protein
VPLVLAPLLLGFGAVGVAFVLYSMHIAAPTWLRSLLNSLAHRQPGENIIVTAALAPERLLVKGLDYVFHRTRHRIAAAVGLQLHPLALWLGALGSLWQVYVRAQDATVGAFADGVFHLRHKTMPREITRRVHPVAVTADHALADSRRSISLNQRERNERRRAIDRIHARWLWPLALAFGGIDAMLHRDLLHRSRTDHRELEHVRTRDLPRIRAKDHAQDKSLSNHRTRIGRLEKILTVTGIAALVWAVLVKWGLQWLRCRNVTKVGRAICRMSPSLLNDLLGLSLALLAVTDPVVIGEAAIKGEELINGLVEELANPSQEATDLTKAAVALLGIGV